MPRLVVAELNDPRYGPFEGGALDDYRVWARRAAVDVARAAARAARDRRALRARLPPAARAAGGVDPRVAHSLPIAYVLGRAATVPPRQRVGPRRYASPPFDAPAARRASPSSRRGLAPAGLVTVGQTASHARRIEATSARTT